MIDTCLILGIMEKEELPNLGKYSFFFPIKQESKFNKFSPFSLSKMLKNTLHCEYCQSRFHFNGHAKGHYPQTQTGYCKVKTTPWFIQAEEGLINCSATLIDLWSKLRDVLQYLMRVLASLSNEARVQMPYLLVFHPYLERIYFFQGPPFFPSSQKPTRSCKFQLDLGMLDDEPICRCSTVQII